MNLSKLAVERPIGILMVICVVLVLGIVSLSRLTIDLLPEMKFPVAAVITNYSGAGPQEIETLVTRPIEEVMGTVNNVKNISSQTSSGNSIVIVEFNWGTNMDMATLQMREKIDLVKRSLPDGTEAPMVFKFDPSMMPVLILGMSGDQDLASLKKVAEDTIKSRLERIDGVASVTVSGGNKREIVIAVDQNRLNGYGLSLAQVTQALQRENLNLPGGKVENGNKEYLIRTTGEFKSLDEIKHLSIPLAGGASIYLGDLADVRDSYSDTTAINTMNGLPSLNISIQKQTNANTVKVADAVHAELANLQKDLPGNVQIADVMDQSVFIKRSISGIVQHAAVGAVLAVLIILLFLQNIRSTLVVATAIPISIITTFILIYFSGLTLNMMSMGGLALGVGRLVDDAIVVFENIYRHRQQGEGRKEAALSGTAEVTMAVVASTLTTISVFLPIVFVQGIAAELFRQMALTVSFSLLASLFVALTLVPMLASNILRTRGESVVKQNFLNKAFDKAADYFAKVEEYYKNFLVWALGHRKKVAIYTVSAFVASLVLVPFIGAEFFPQMDEGQINISIKMANGTVLAETKRVADRVEAYVNQIPEVETVFVSVGSAGNRMSLGGDSSDTASIDVRLKPLKERKRSVFQIINLLRTQVQEIPGADIKITASSSLSGGGLSGPPISVNIKGNDFAVLEDLANEIKDRMESVPGTKQVATSLSEGRPEVQIVFKRDKLASLGLSASQVAQAVRTSMEGQVATIYRVGGEEIDVRVRLAAANRQGIQDLKQLLLSTPTGAQIPLADVADLKEAVGPNTISRDNQARVVTVTADIAGRDLRSVVADIQKKLIGLNIPHGYTVEFGGQNKEMVDAFKNLLLALVLAIFLVYMILAAQFESLTHPFTIMFTVPLAFIGVSLGLFLTGRTLNVASFIGIIMLVGIVTNNAIVLVDYINKLRARGLERYAAIVTAGQTRLRPILMTALATILGLFPLALGIGEGAETQAGMATVVIGGLLLATVLTLVIIPVVYISVDNFGSRVKQRLSGKKVPAGTTVNS